MKNETLQQKIYEISNSELPLNSFYNDIQRNNKKNFNKEMALKDLEKIADFIIDLQEENKILQKALELSCKDVNYLSCIGICEETRCEDCPIDNYIKQAKESLNE